jgi:hypothetical protein
VIGPAGAGLEREILTSDGLVRAVAAKGLSGSSLDFPDQALDAPEWDKLVESIHLHRLTGLLAAVVHDGDLPATPEQRHQARAGHAAAMHRCLQLEADLIWIADLFDRCGVRYRVLKGSAFAHLDYPDPALRAFIDIDLLTPGEHYEAAVDALTSVGYERTFRELRPGFDRRFGKGASFTGPVGHEVDLHRTFVSGPYGLTVDLDDVWRSSDRFEIAGRSFETLDPDQRFLHACYHAAIGKIGGRLGPLRDLAGMLQRPGNGVRIDRALGLSARWKSTAVVARAVNMAWEAFALTETPLSRWARDFSPSDRDRQALRTYLDPDMGEAARSYVAIRAIPGARAKAAFAWALAFPSRSYGAGRHGDHRRRWRAAARQIIALRRGDGPS